MVNQGAQEHQVPRAYLAPPHPTPSLPMGVAACAQQVLADPRVREAPSEPQGLQVDQETRDVTVPPAAPDLRDHKDLPAPPVAMENLGNKDAKERTEPQEPRDPPDPKDQLELAGQRDQQAHLVPTEREATMDNLDPKDPLDLRDNLVALVSPAIKAHRDHRAKMPNIVHAHARLRLQLPRNKRETEELRNEIFSLCRLIYLVSLSEGRTIRI